MEARSKTIENWFSEIKSGQIVLPRFQRHGAWNLTQIEGLLENVLRKPELPIGTLLVLEVGDKELFSSRPIEGAPELGGQPTMHLLDGQQRMTALWRSLTGNYTDLDIFVSLGPGTESESNDDENSESDQPVLEFIKRRDGRNGKLPTWPDAPEQCFERNLIPITCFQPGGEGEERLREWLERIHDVKKLGMYSRIYELRNRVGNYVIPFLSLGPKTGIETALNVFINMNTSASPLKDYDIVVAQVEGASKESLHRLIEMFLEEQPIARDYGKIEDIVLSVSALLLDWPPLKKIYLTKEFGEKFYGNWEKTKNSIRRGLEFLREEAIFNKKFVPTDVAVYLVCALWGNIPEHGFDKEGNARTLLRKVLWRACYSNRYGKTSATRSFTDYKVLKEILSSPDKDISCLLFNEEHCSLPKVNDIKLAGWPGRRDQLARATVATALRNGGYDLADGAPAKAENMATREYHHIFPVSILKDGGQGENANLAMNCAFITWRTNRKIAAKTPREYIEMLVGGASLGEDEIRRRCESHLIPFDALAKGDYQLFMEERARLIWERMNQLCEGRVPD